MAVPDNSKSPYRARSTDAGNLSTDFFGPCVCWRTDNPVGLAKVIRHSFRINAARRRRHSRPRKVSCWRSYRRFRLRLVVEEASPFYYRIQSPVTFIEFDHHER